MRLVEKAEPELVIGLVSQAELDHRLVGREPPSRTTHTGPLEFSGVRTRATPRGREGGLGRAPSPTRSRHA